MVYEYFITSQVLNLYFILQILGIFGIHEFVITGWVGSAEPSSDKIDKVGQKTWVWQ